MSYLSETEFEAIMDTVDILPITSEKLGDISQYSFDVGKAAEYATFIVQDAKRLDVLGISKTFVIIHKSTKELIGYFTLSADTVKLVNEEKEGTELEVVPFMTLPAVKVGKLAINKKLSEGVACRFLTVDADIEYYPDTPKFYEKNGFRYNLSKKRKASDKTISMRRDIFAE